MNIIIEHTHGGIEKYLNLDDALISLHSKYGDEIVISGDDDSLFANIRILVWKNEEDSERNAEAVAVIRTSRE